MLTKFLFDDLFIRLCIKGSLRYLSFKPIHQLHEVMARYMYLLRSPNFHFRKIYHHCSAHFVLSIFVPSLMDIMDLNFHLSQTTTFGTNFIESLNCSTLYHYKSFEAVDNSTIRYNQKLHHLRM